MNVIDTPLIRRHRLTVEAYHRMAEVGLLAPDERVELIEGEVIDMAPVGTRHMATVSRLNRALTEAVGRAAIVSVQNSIRLGRRSEPQPDLVLLKSRDDFYAARHPTPADTLLVIEVSDSSAAYDRQIKVPLYARHGIAELWIVDLDARLVRFYRQPQGETYLDITATETPGPTGVAALPGVTVDLSGILSL